MSRKGISFLSYGMIFCDGHAMASWCVRLSRLLAPGCRPGRAPLRRHTATSSLFLPGEEPTVPLDWQRLLDPASAGRIAAEVRRRKGVGDVHKVQELHRRYLAADGEQRPALLAEMVAEALRIPNRTRPRPGLTAARSGAEEPEPVAAVGSCSEEAAADDEEEDMFPVRTVGEKRTFDFPVKDFRHRAEKLNMFRMDNLGLLTGSRTYYLKRDLAELEAALVRFALTRLCRAGFRLVSVPDLLSSHVLEACGVPVHGDRTMVYSLDERRHGDVCLSGTAEMALASLVSGRRLPPELLPLRLAAVSRCFRPEVSNLESESGLYRVHQFTKVEMFGVCEGDESLSSALLEEFLDIQQQIFTDLGLHFIVYDMPPHELGAPAYRKYDIEAWMPGRAMYGEVSSASDCTDYQARRLDVRDAAGRLVHTVNGTACAAPRTLLALVETHQNRDGTVAVPPPLMELMGREVIRPSGHKAQWIRPHRLKVKLDE